MKRILSAIFAVVMMLSAVPVANIFIDTDTAITAEAATTYYTTTAALNLRKGPGTGYAVIIKMPKGAKVKYLGKSGSFYKVSYTKNSKTYTGYCSSSYLKKVTTASMSSADKKYVFTLFRFFEYGAGSYSSSASSAVNKAYKAMFGEIDGSFETIFKHYGWSYSSCKNDPKNYYKKHSAEYGICGCQKISASKVDWILKNVYNVTPDHSKVVKGEYGGVLAYYYNGYYYHFMYQGGDAPVYYKTTSCSQSNGYYILKGGIYSTENYTDKWGTFSAKLKLKTVDGKKVWSIYSYTYKAV